MKKSTYDKIRSKLRRAEKAIQDLEESKSFIQDADAWNQFLIAANGIFDVMDAGLKGHNKGEPWFGDKKHKRKLDPLLQYLHLARNAEEHGLEEVITEEPSGWWVTGDVVLNGVIGGPSGTNLKVTQIPGGDPIGFGSKRAHAKVVPVRSFGIEYAVPTSHLGITIEVEHELIFGVTPLALARVAYPYLRVLVVDAERFVKT